MLKKKTSENSYCINFMTGSGTKATPYGAHEFGANSSWLTHSRCVSYRGYTIFRRELV